MKYVFIAFFAFWAICLASMLLDEFTNGRFPWLPVRDETRIPRTRSVPKGERSQKHSSKN